jgi:predicted nucleic acid-binding protein
LTSFLIDTNILSEVIRPAPDRRVVNFLARESDLWLSVITLHELTYGAARVTDVARRERLATWIESVKGRFRGRLIPVDEAIAGLAGQTRGHAATRGRTVDPLDALIAATAQTRSKTLATRNVRDFVALEVVTLNPWTDGGQ